MAPRSLHPDAGLGSISPTTAVNAPFLFQNDVHPVTKLDLDLASVDRLGQYQDQLVP
jgi:hypothetical protein